MCRPVALESLCNLWHKRVIRVGICQQRADGQQHLRTADTVDAYRKDRG
jgi:hypothetical protein